MNARSFYYVISAAPESMPFYAALKTRRPLSLAITAWHGLIVNVYGGHETGPYATAKEALAAARFEIDNVRANHACVS
jgi:hypothetical protein